MSAQRAHAAATGANPRPTPAELLRRAEALLPILRERSAGCEQARQVHPESMAAFTEAGFFDVLKPARYGGYEYEPQVMFDIVTKLASACTASGWVCGLLMIHNWEIGQANPKLAADIWREDQQALISSSYAPFGAAEKVEGGWRVTGRWPWSSGCDHCSWLVVGVFFPEPPSPENPFGVRQRALFLPRSDYVIDQSSWHMAGMQGTGSKDVVLDGVFVPEHRHHDLTEAFFDRQAGAGEFTALTYRYPFAMVFAYTLASVILGSAEGALQVFADGLKGKRTPMGTLASDNPFNQLRLGEARAMSNAARAVLERDFAEARAFLERGEVVPKPNRAQYKWNAAYVARTAVDAIEKLVKSAGGSSFALGHPMQRFFRDTQCATNHAFLAYETHAADAGHMLLSGQVRSFLI